MTLQEKKLIDIRNYISNRYGEDIAQDVVVALLTSSSKNINSKRVAVTIAKRLCWKEFSNTMLIYVSPHKAEGYTDVSIEHTLTLKRAYDLLMAQPYGKRLIRYVTSTGKPKFEHRFMWKYKRNYLEKLHRIGIEL